MYVPGLFKISEREALSVIADEEFAILVDVSNESGWATHLPLILETGTNGQHRLYGHFAKGNPQAETVANGARAMAIFSGPHDYISPTWYENPTSNVPTWNYLAVHVYGRLNTLAPEAAEHSMKVLCDRYEGEWSMDGLPAPQRDKMLHHGIVPFVMDIDDIHAKAKLSQNRSSVEKETIITKLEDTGSGALAAAMRVHHNKNETQQTR